MDTEIVTLKNILLVEDDPRDVELTLAALEEQHLANRVAVVNNGAEALDYLYRRGEFKLRAGGNPTVVLLDNKMPKVNGLEVLKTIKADEHLKTIPVVAFTSSRETADLIEFYRHGVNAYVVKPVDFPDFMQAVKQLGVFWAAINEPPPQTGREEVFLQKGEAILPGKKVVKPNNRMNAINGNIMPAIPTLALIAAAVLLVTSTPLCASDTDDRIEAAFSKSYAYKIYLKDDAIKTESRNGVVTLTGQVNEASHKYLAQEAVAGLPGVQRVDNRLKVTLEGTEKSDPWIRAKVRSVLALHRNVSGSSTQVDIRDGVITLRGAATSEAQKELATEYAKDVKGVLRVTNVMTVAKHPAQVDETVCETIDDASITAQVKVALLSHHSTSAVTTTVGTIDGVVTVGGIARNAAEKTLVTKLATDISGVKSVVNNMTLAPAVSESGAKPARAENPRVMSARDLTASQPPGKQPS